MDFKKLFIAAFILITVNIFFLGLANLIIDDLKVEKFNHIKEIHQLTTYVEHLRDKNKVLRDSNEYLRKHQKK